MLITEHGLQYYFQFLKEKIILLMKLGVAVQSRLTAFDCTRALFEKWKDSMQKQTLVYSAENSQHAQKFWSKSSLKVGSLLCLSTLIRTYYIRLFNAISYSESCRLIYPKSLFIVKSVVSDLHTSLAATNRAITYIGLHLYSSKHFTDRHPTLG